MKIGLIQEILGAGLISIPETAHMHNLDSEQLYCANLMSDVFAFSHNNSLLTAHLTNKPASRTTEITNINAIMFV